MKPKRLIKEDVLDIKNRLNAISLKFESSYNNICEFFEDIIRPKLKKILDRESSYLDYYATSESLLEIFAQLIIVRPEKLYILDIMQKIEKRLDESIQNQGGFRYYQSFIDYILPPEIFDSLPSLTKLMNNDEFKETFWNIEKIEKMITPSNFGNFKTFLWHNLLISFGVWGDTDPAGVFKKTVKNFLNALEYFGPSIQYNRNDYYHMLNNRKDYYIPPNKEVWYSRSDDNADMF